MNLFKHFSSPTVPFNFQQRGERHEGIPGRVRLSLLELFEPGNAALLRSLFHHLCKDFSEDVIIALAAAVAYKKAPTFGNANIVLGLLVEANVKKERLAILGNTLRPGGYQRHVRGARTPVQNPAVSPTLFDGAIEDLLANLTEPLYALTLRTGDDGAMNYYRAEPRGPRVGPAVLTLQNLSRSGLPISQVLLSA